MLMQQTWWPHVHQIKVYVAAVRRDFPKADVQVCQIGAIQNRSFPARVSSVSVADEAALRCRAATEYDLKTCYVTQTAAEASWPMAFWRILRRPLRDRIYIHFYSLSPRINL